MRVVLGATPDRRVAITGVKEMDAKTFAAAMDSGLRGIKLAGSLSSMSDKHHAIAEALASGAKPEDVAEEFDMTPTYVRAIADSPAFRNKVAVIRKNGEDRAASIHAKLMAATEKAVEKLETMIDATDSPAFSLEAFTELADRAGFSPVRKQVSATMPVDDVLNAMNAHRENARVFKLGEAPIVDADAGAEGSADTAKVGTVVNG